LVRQAQEEQAAHRHPELVLQNFLVATVVHRSAEPLVAAVVQQAPVEQVPTVVQVTQ
jgi:hypothetical protein